MKKKPQTDPVIEEISGLAFPLGAALHHFSGAAKMEVSDKVTFRQLQALAMLGHGPLTVGELGRRLDIAASTATELCSRLESTGLIERGEGGDRRSRSIALTASGRKKVNRYGAKLSNAMAARLARLSPQKRKELLMAFRTIISVLSEEAS